MAAGRGWLAARAEVQGALGGVVRQNALYLRDVDKKMVLPGGSKDQQRDGAEALAEAESAISGELTAADHLLEAEHPIGRRCG